MYFISSLVSPWIKYKIMWFLKNFKFWKPSGFWVSSFWHSLEKESSNFSSNFNVKTTTLKKIKVKHYFKKLLLYFFKSSQWCSFYTIDIAPSSLWSLMRLWQSVFFTEYSKDSIKLFSTNKQINKIFWYFTFWNVLPLNKLHFFKEKYFAWEKFTWAASLSNVLRSFVIRFFTYFIPNKFVAKFFKSNDLFLKKNTTIASSTLFNFTNLFTNKWIFVFFTNQFIMLKFLNFISLPENSSIFFDLILFSNGYFFTKITEFFLYKHQLVFIKKHYDLTFIEFFLLNFSKVKLDTNFTLHEEINKFQRTKKILFFSFLNSSFFFTFKIFYLFYLFYLLKFILFIKIKSLQFTLRVFFKPYYFLCQHFNNY